ncbi:MAG TPA: succinate dehydrogenase cytochrome b subunit [Gemmatimonadales bacterium]|jgi:succinate dehydrogenase / fumarate reductase, cytochrome b subunit|nr:succinate dehydrogenase cytochrome b subunit [Gemmatimonadales bacterium]
MNDPAGFARSTIGRKVIMAATGILLVGFLVGHVAGNLLVFAGPGPLNAWSAFLKSSMLVLWAVRIGLLAAAGLHVWAALSLTRLNNASRPVAYARREPQAATLASRLMRWGGFLLLAFIVFHLLHLTTGSITPGFVLSHTDVYGNVTSAFQVPWVALFYIVAMLALLAHLTHGIWSFFQTMGWNHPRFDRARRVVATVVALIVSLGFIAIPAAILGGMLR